jgi:hypothetical protein
MTVLESPRGVPALQRGTGHHVYLNLSDEPQHVELPRGRIVLDTTRELDGEETALRGALGPRQGLVVFSARWPGANNARTHGPARSRPKPTAAEQPTE